MAHHSHGERRRMTKEMISPMACRNTSTTPQVIGTTSPLLKLAQGGSELAGDARSWDPRRTVSEPIRASEDAIKRQFAAVRALKRAGDVAGLLGMAQDRAVHPLWRGRAVRALRTCATPADVSAIATLLDNGDSDIRIAATRAIATIGGPDAHQVILNALDHEDRVVVAWAAHDLGHLGSAEDVPRLTSLLASSDRRVRLGARHSLMKLGGATARRALRGAASQDHGLDKVRMLVAAVRARP
jgi:HEAT repeat protein